jgi:PP-loop superfamily ATP-utilizing enzyme
MKMVHITKTTDGGYFIADATGAPDGGATPTSKASTEEGLRVVLKRFGLTQKAIENAVRQLNDTGNATVSL